MANRQIPLSLMLVGPPGAGKGTVAGCLLYKCGAIDLLMMERFQDQAINTYQQISKELRRQGAPLAFESPKRRYVIVDTESQSPVRYIIVVSPDTITSLQSLKLPDLPSPHELIVLMNKMDDVEWSRDTYDDIVKTARTHLLNTYGDTQRMSFIPFSALTGENLLELSSKSPWYSSQFEPRLPGPVQPGTLLAALDGDD